MAARGDKIGFAHGQANNFLITKRLEGGGLSDKDILDLAGHFMAEDSKPTPTPAKTYLTAAVDLALKIDEKTEQKEHIAMLLSFYETHKDDGDRGRKSGRGNGSARSRGRGGGRGGHGGNDGAAPRKQTPGPPTSRGNDAVTSGNTKKIRCTHQGCPSPQTHDTSACKYHAQLVFDRKHEREKATCAADFFSALSSNKSGDGSASSYYSSSY